VKKAAWKEVRKEKREVLTFHVQRGLVSRYVEAGFENKGDKDETNYVSRSLGLKNERYRARRRRALKTAHHNEKRATNIRVEVERARARNSHRVVTKSFIQGRKQKTRV